MHALSPPPTPYPPLRAGLVRVRAARKAGQPSSSPSGPVPAWALATVEEGLSQLWGSEQLQRAKGGPMYNTHKPGEQQMEAADLPCPADMYNLATLKRIIQKLDALNKVGLAYSGCVGTLIWAYGRLHVRMGVVSQASWSGTGRNAWGAGQGCSVGCAGS